MNNTIGKFLIAVAALVLFYATAAVIATFSQLANGADRIYAGSGQVVFLIFLACFIGLALTPVVLFLRLPKSMAPPDTAEEPAYTEYRNSLLAELRVNPNLRRFQCQTLDDIPAALHVLSGRVDKVIKNAASAIFVSTAVMQNGRLDGLIVLVTQARLVWQIAGIYHRRPSPRQAIYLYSNVGAAMLTAINLDDVDFAELVSPMVSSMAPSLVGAVPGLQGIASLLTNSMADGAANALLTLRVGMMTKAYCAHLVHPKTAEVRRSASRDALGMLGDITKENGGRVASAVWEKSTGGIASAAGAASRGVKAAASATAGLATTAATSAGQGLNAAAGHVRRGTASAAEATSDTGKLIGRAAASATNSAVASVEGAMNATVEHLRSGSAAVAQTSVDVGKKIVQATSSIASSSVSSLESALKTTADHAAKGTAAIAGASSEVGTKIGRAVGVTVDSAKNLGSKTADALSSVLNRKANRQDE